MDVNTNALRWQLPLMDDVCAFVDDGILTFACFVRTHCIFPRPRFLDISDETVWDLCPLQIPLRFPSLVLQKHRINAMRAAGAMNFERVDALGRSIISSARAVPAKGHARMAETANAMLTRAMLAKAML